MIWSHGGQAGTPALMSRMAAMTAGACYISISIGHPAVNPALASDWCASFNPAIPAGAECDEAVGKTFKALDIGGVIDEVDRIYGAIPILVGGHSGGASATMLVAGADRSIGPNRLAGSNGVVQPERAEPVAFITTSPTGPNYAGFFASTFNDDATSWDNVDRPLLAITGTGDNQCTGAHPGAGCAELTTPWNRQAPFFLSPATSSGAGAKYLLFIRDVEAFHNSFRLGAGECDPNGPVASAKCRLVFGHIESAVLAFTDANLRNIAAAQSYLAGNDITSNPNLDVAWRKR